jgi:hypothetical protein
VEVDRCQQVESMLSLHRPLFPAEAAEQETQRTARAAGWDRSAGEEERSFHRLRQFPEQEMAAPAVGIDLDPWAREAGTLLGLPLREAARMAERVATARRAEELAPATEVLLEE